MVEVLWIKIEILALYLREINEILQGKEIEIRRFYYQMFISILFNFINNLTFYLVFYFILLNRKILIGNNNYLL